MTDDGIVFSELSKGEIPELIERIAQIARETGAHNQDTLDRRMWTWQYEDLPTRESFVYVARHAGEIVGYYHIPVYDFLAGDQKLLIGQIQSVAVSSKMRGQGLFRRLADFAHEELNEHTDLIYTFPNVRSIHTFLKYNGYGAVAALPIFLLPLRTADIIRSRVRLFGFERLAGSLFDLRGRLYRKGLSPDEVISVRPSFDDETVALFKAFQSAHTFRLARDRNYLKWRYLDTPKGPHFIVGLEREGALKSVAVVKYDELFSTRGLLVMDFAHGGDPADLNKLLTNLSGLFGARLPHEAAFVMVSGLANHIGELKKAGFISLPQRLIPRQLNLLARWMRTTGEADLHNPRKWLVTLGDWDVF